MHAIIALNTARADFTPAQIHTQNNDEIFGQSPNGPPQRLPVYKTDNDNRAAARVAPTIGDIIGAYKSLVANQLSRTYNSQLTIY